MNKIRLIVFIGLCLCIPLIGILIVAHGRSAEDKPSPDIDILKKIASQSIKKAFEETQDIKKAASLVGVETQELARLCIALDIDIDLVRQEIAPVPVDSMAKYGRIENETDVVLNNDGFVPYVLLVEKGAHTLYLLEFRDGGRHVVNSFECKTGINHGDKKTSGDNKTPEGIYFLTRKYSRKDIIRIVGRKNAYQYGELAFATNFPNAIDRLNGKKGGGIWLHGTDEKFEETSSNDTRGCVVTTNETIKELDRYIEPGKTPMIIVDELNFDTAGNIEERRKEALTFINNWKSAWKRKYIDDYISCYSESFRSQGLSLSRWKNDKQRKWKRNNEHRIITEDIIIYNYNNEMVARFKQHFSIMDNRGSKVIYPSTGMKTLYLVWEDNSWKIIAEKFNQQL